MEVHNYLFPKYGKIPKRINLLTAKNQIQNGKFTFRKGFSGNR